MNEYRNHLDLENLLSGECSQDEFAMWEDQLGAETVQRMLQGDKQLREAVEESVLTDPRVLAIREVDLSPMTTDLGALTRFLSKWGLPLGIVVLVIGVMAVVPLFVSSSVAPVESSIKDVSEALSTPLVLTILGLILILTLALQGTEADSTL